MGPYVPGRNESAPVGRRLAARLIDQLLWLVLPSYVLLQPYLPKQPDKSFTLDLAKVDSWRIVLMVITYPVVEALLLLVMGRTVGKLLMKVRVASVDGSPMAPQQAVVRAMLVTLPFVATFALPNMVGQIIGAIPLVLLVTILIDPQRRGLHDKVARTTVMSALTGHGRFESSQLP
jgi:uncharacterized RDD family membrane protein YckC